MTVAFLLFMKSNFSSRFCTVTVADSSPPCTQSISFAKKRDKAQNKQSLRWIWLMAFFSQIIYRYLENIVILDSFDGNNRVVKIWYYDSSTNKTFWNAKLMYFYPMSFFYYYSLVLQLLFFFFFYPRYILIDNVVLQSLQQRTLWLYCLISDWCSSGLFQEIIQCK